MARRVDKRSRAGRDARRPPRTDGVRGGGGSDMALVMDVIGRDADGELLVRRTKTPDGEALRLVPGPDLGGAPGVGDRILARLRAAPEGGSEAQFIKKLGQSAHRVLGVVRKSRREIRIEPVDRKSKEAYVAAASEAELSDGDLVLVEPMARVGRFGVRSCRVLEVIGRETDPKAASLIALTTHGVVLGFSDAARHEAAAAPPAGAEVREDLRSIPLVTIDPEDARDHDDAVFAQRTDTGFEIFVAIADVARYVRYGGVLDREAWTKGNSVYFPDRVEPMLPEILSADRCSLIAHEDRPALVVRIKIDSAGRKTSHAFTRALIRSAASLSYQQAQAAADGDPDEVCAPLVETVIMPLWAAYRALCAARALRSPLDIDSPERRIELSPDGVVTGVRARERLEAHRLIEEMMVLANVCAAETLEAKRTPLIYRIHDAPNADKMFALSDFLSTVGMHWTRGEAPRTDRFNRLLEQARGGPHAEIVNEVVLRTQMQAVYSPDNIGHFGLNLARYAHFTSPIRRYADLIVHRALIRALKLGEDGLTGEEIARLAATADHITATERAAMAAERDAADRYLAAYLEGHVGATFKGRVTGVTRFGLFIRLTDTGADGLAPISSLGVERFLHDERAHALVGERTGLRWRLGALVDVRLREVAPVTGGLLFEVLSDPEPGPRPAPLRRAAGPPLRRRR